MEHEISVLEHKISVLEHNLSVSEQIYGSISAIIIPVRKNAMSPLVLFKHNHATPIDNFSSTTNNKQHYK
jgi:hypothetical protein